MKLHCKSPLRPKVIPGMLWSNYITDMLQEDTFELPVAYNGRELLLPSRFVQMGYTFKIFVDAEGQEIIFEPDEERNFRAIIEQTDGAKTVPTELVKAISDSIEKNFGS